MEYFAPRWQDYHPILMGAGSLALGYIYGRHCRSIVENHHIDNVPMELDATCNPITSHAALEAKKILMVQRLASSPSDSTLNSSTKNIGVTLGRIGKRTIRQLEIFKMPRKNKDLLWTQSSTFKKEKGIPIITIQKKEPIVQSKVEPIYDSDDKSLARWPEYFINQRTSINKPSGSNHVLKVDKKKIKKMKSTTKETTMSSKGKDLVTIDSLKSLSKTSTRSRSGLCDLAHLYNECSLEDTCRSPMTTMCLENSIQVAMTEPMQMPYVQASKLEFVVSNPLQEHIGDDRVGSMDLQCELNELAKDLDHTIDEYDKEERLENVKIENGIVIKQDDIVVVESLEEKMPTS